MVRKECLELMIYYLFGHLVQQTIYEDTCTRIGNDHTIIPKANVSSLRNRDNREHCFKNKMRNYRTYSIMGTKSEGNTLSMFTISKGLGDRLFEKVRI
jgi:hypothetical protein